MKLDEWSETRARTAVFALAGAVRLAYLAIVRPEFEGYHWQVADTLLREGFVGLEGHPTSLYDPIYPLFIAGARIVSRDVTPVVQVLQITIDCAAAVLLFNLARTLTASLRVALIAASLYAVYPLMIHHAIVADEFSLVSLLLIAFANATARPTAPRAAAAGTWLGLGILTRAMVAPILPLTAVVFAARRHYRAAAWLCVSALLVQSPWLVRNYSLIDGAWPTRSGENLFHGNSAYTAAMLPRYNLDLLAEYGQAMVAQRRPDLGKFFTSDTGHDVMADREIHETFTKLAWEQIESQPLQTIALSLWKCAYFFWPRAVPSHQISADTTIEFASDGQVQVKNSPERPWTADLAYTVSYSVVAAAAVAGIWIRRSALGADAILWCIVLTFVLVAMVYFPATRQRVPMEFVLLFYAAVAFEDALTSLSKEAV
jgi:hypothetical protein